MCKNYSCSESNYEAPIQWEYCIAGNNGGNYIWQFAPCSSFGKSAHLHNTKVVANGLNFNYGRNLIWKFI